MMHNYAIFWRFFMVDIKFRSFKDYLYTRHNFQMHP